MLLITVNHLNPSHFGFTKMTYTHENLIIMYLDYSVLCLVCSYKDAQPRDHKMLALPEFQ